MQNYAPNSAHVLPSSDQKKLYWRASSVKETSSIATAAYCSSVFVGETVEWATEKQNVQETFSNSWKCAINQIFILIL